MDYPKIKVNIFVDEFSAMAGTLNKIDFLVEEDGNEVTIDDFYFMGNTSGQRLDLAVVFDNTNSMQQEIDGMKANVKDLTDSLGAAGIDASYSLVSFGNDISVRREWTDDPVAFNREVDSLSIISGIDEPENPLDAIEAVLSMGFRPDAQKVVLVITDDRAHHREDGCGISNYTKEEVEADLKESGVILAVVSPEFEGSTEYVDLREFAEDTDSVWIDIESDDFSAILEQFKSMLTGTYVIEYTSAAAATANSRTVSVSVNAPECKGCEATSSYSAPESLTGPDESAAISSPTPDDTSPPEAGEVVTGAGEDAATQDAEAWVNIGLALNSQEEYEDAIMAYDEAIKLDPEYVLVWVCKGLAFYGQGKYDEAIQAYDEAIRLDPEYVLAWDAKGIALLKEKRLDEAIQAYEEAFRLNPEYAAVMVAPMLAKAWAGKGLVLLNEGKHDEAVQAFDEVIRLDPKLVEGWVGKGVALEILGRRSEANAAYAKARELGWTG